MWWESFVEPYWTLKGDEALKLVAATITYDSPHWFVAESWMPQKKESNFWIYKAQAQSILKILRETHYHEYYIIDQKMNSLICENHHGVVIC